MPWPIVDANGFEDLRIGDTRVMVRERFGAYRTARRDPNDTVEFDYFVESGVMAYFGDENRVISIELSEPAEPEVQGVSLIGRKLASLLTDFKSIGIAYRQDISPGAEGGFLEGLNIGLWIPDSTVESVLIGGEDMNSRS